MGFNISSDRVKEIIKEELEQFNPDLNGDGFLSEPELFDTFDQNHDGKLPVEEFQDSLEWICNNEHIVAPFLVRRETSHQSVPCSATYDNASRFLLRDVDSIYNNSYESINGHCGAECPISVMTALIDIMRSFEEIENV